MAPGAIHGAQLLVQLMQWPVYSGTFAEAELPVWTLTPTALSSFKCSALACGWEAVAVGNQAVLFVLSAATNTGGEVCLFGCCYSCVHKLVIATLQLLCAMLVYSCAVASMLLIVHIQ